MVPDLDTPELDADGNPKLDEDGNPICPMIVRVDSKVKTMKYSVLYMKAIKCLQEAQTRIETLEAKVAVLEG